jgi:YceI-like domain.
VNPLAIVGIVMIFFLLPPKEEPALLRHHFIVLPASKLTIHGKTNVNSFKCSITQYCGRDTLVLQEGGNSRPVFIKGYVGLEAAGFDCGMAMMTSDFTKTIRAKEYPMIGIDFKSFEKVPSYACKEEKFKGIMAIHLSGETKIFEVDCTLETQPSGLIHLKGARSFTFSDFKLVPPKRMMGMVTVQENLDVSFHLVLKLDPNSW